MTKEVMEQYEQVRALGLCSMWDFFCVMRIARKRKFYALSALTMNEYGDIIKNSLKYMDKFGVKRLQ